MPNVQMPNGDIVGFPDDMPGDKIKGLIASKFPDVSKVNNSSSDQSFGSAYTSRVDQAANNIDEDITAPYKQDKTAGPNWLQRIGDIGGRIGNAAVSFLQAGTAAVPAALQTGVTQPIVNAVTPDKVTPEQAEKLGKVKQDTADLTSQALFAATGAKDMPQTLSGFKSIKQIREGISGAIPKGAKDLLTSEASGSSVAPQELPQGNFGPLGEANKTGLLEQGKDPLLTGQNTIRAINKGYETANETASLLYKTQKMLGEGKTTSAESIEQPLSKTINELQDSAVTSQQTSTLRRLKAIQEKYFSEGPESNNMSGMSVAGETVASPAKQIALNDLVEIKQALNEGFNSNDFTKSSEIPLVKLNNAVKDTISGLETEHPSFVQSGEIADEFYGREVAQKFKDNPQLQDLWQPSDYYAYKANIKDPNAQEFPADTQARAGELIDRLTNDKGGKVQALVDALPHDEAVEVLHQALLKAKEITPSLKNVALNLIGKSGTHGTVGTPIYSVEQAIRNLIGSLNPATKNAPLLDLANRVTSKEGKLPTKAIGTGTLGYLGYKSIGGKTNDQSKKGNVNVSPQSSADPIGATNSALAASKKNDFSFNLSDLNPISEADASEIKIPQNSPISGSVKDFKDTRDGPALTAAMKKYGVTPNEMMTLVNAESSIKSDSSKGYAQITGPAWKQSEQLVGRSLNRTNPNDYAEAAVAYYKWTAGQVKQVLGTQGTPSVKDVYAAYNAGVEGFKALHNANPSDIALNVVPAQVAKNNRYFYYDKDGTPLTVRQTLQAYRAFVSTKMNEYTPVNASKSTKAALIKATKITNPEPDGFPIKDKTL